MDGVTVENRRSRRAVVAGAAAGLTGLGVGLLRPEAASAASFTADSFHTTNGAFNAWNDPNGALELGKTTANPGAQLPYIDFRWAPSGTYANSGDYNARIQNDADNRLTMRFAGGGFTQMTNGGVIANSPGGSVLTANNGGITANPNLATTATRPFLWQGTIPDSFPGPDIWTSHELIANYQRQNVSSGFFVGYHGARSIVSYGTPSLNAKGTTHCFTAVADIHGCDDAESEHCLYFGRLAYNNGTATNPGRSWLTDWNLHGAVNKQQGFLNGIVMFANNYYAGSPSVSDSAAMWILTRPGSGANAHPNATHPLDHGIAVAGSAGDPGGNETLRQGFKIGIRVGGGGRAGGPWGVQASRIGKGMLIQDYEEQGIYFPSRWNGASGTAPAIRVEPNAGGIIALGGLVIKTKSSNPVAADDLGTGTMVFNTANNRLYVRNGTQWRYVTLNNIL